MALEKNHNEKQTTAITQILSPLVDNIIAKENNAIALIIVFSFP